MTAAQTRDALREVLARELAREHETGDWDYQSLADAALRVLAPTLTEASALAQRSGEERDRAVAASGILLAFVDYAAGEGLDFCASGRAPAMTAVDVVEQAAAVLGFELGDSRYEALLASGEKAIRAARSVTEPTEGEDAR